MKTCCLKLRTCGFFDMQTLNLQSKLRYINAFLRYTNYTPIINKLFAFNLKTRKDTVILIADLSSAHQNTHIYQVWVRCQTKSFPTQIFTKGGRDQKRWKTNIVWNFVYMGILTCWPQICNQNCDTLTRSCDTPIIHQL